MNGEAAWEKSGSTGASTGAAGSWSLTGEEWYRLSQDD
jgi:hypothetical protein